LKSEFILSHLFTPVLLIDSTEYNLIPPSGFYKSYFDLSLSL